MVSKSLVCLALFALVAVCLCAPPQKRNFKKEQTIDCSNSNSDSNSDSNSSEDKPCDFTKFATISPSTKGKGLKTQDTSASEEWGKKLKIKISGEDKTSMEIHKAPEHQRIKESHISPDYAHGKKARQNIQKSRNQDIDSNENQSQIQKNQIDKQNKNKY